MENVVDFESEDPIKSFKILVESTRPFDAGLGNKHCRPVALTSANQWKACLPGKYST